MAQKYIELKSGKRLLLSGIKGACRFFNGIKAVSDMTGIPNSSLNSWIRGQQPLSDDRAEIVLNALELPDGNPKNGVHEWRYSVQWPDLKEAIELYFPYGAELARTGWSRPGIKNMLKHLGLVHFRKTAPNEIYLLKYKKVMAVVRMPSGILWDDKMLGKNVKWRGGNFKSAAFSLGNDEEEWFKGPVSIEAFDRAWESHFVSWDDIIERAREINISANQNMDWLNSHK